MSSKKPAIPSTPIDPEARRFNQAIKENLETITGARGDKIALLDPNAGLSDVIAKLNQILGVLQ